VPGRIRRLVTWPHRGAPSGAEITPVEPDPGHAGEGRNVLTEPSPARADATKRDMSRGQTLGRGFVGRVPRALTIATSDSGGGAGIQADLKAFAAAGCHGTSVLVALTAQNTTAVTAVHELPSAFVREQLDAVFSDIGVDAAKTGMLFSRRLIELVAGYVEEHPVPLVVDPVMIASSGARLLQEDAVETYVRRLFPLATVVTPNLNEAVALAGLDGSRRELAERVVELGAPAVIVTGGHGREAVDHLFDGVRHTEIPVERHDIPATHGAGCTHSATLAAWLARGASLEEAARKAAIGAGEGPVDVLDVKGAA
jgi:hydroxymethylpyrimidine/phosphomethylpyrimidine kinase